MHWLGASIKGKIIILIELDRGDIFLLDDPLSALDAQVATRLLNVILGSEFKDQTFLITTNNQNYLKFADRILYLENGKLGFNGSYSEFLLSENYQKFTVSGNENLEVRLDWLN